MCADDELSGCCAGFIDFIVEPSFQVMTDVIDKILEPMQQERQKQTPGITGSPHSSKTSPRHGTAIQAEHKT